MTLFSTQLHFTVFSGRPLIVRPPLNLDLLASSILKPSLQTLPSHRSIQKPLKHGSSYHISRTITPIISLSFQFFCTRSFLFPVTHPVSLCVQGSLPSTCKCCLQQPIIVCICQCVCVLVTDSERDGFLDFTIISAKQAQIELQVHKNLLLASPCSPQHAKEKTHQRLRRASS